MGSWFSSDSNNEKNTSHQKPQTYIDVNRIERSLTSNNNVMKTSHTLQENNGNSYYSTPSSNRSQCIDIGGYKTYSVVKTVESSLYKFVLELTVGWNHMNDSSEFELCLLTPCSREYEQMSRLFKRTTQKQFKVDKIYRVQNPYLLGYYLLKKEEIQSRYGYVHEEYLFHGTKEENRDKICENNFDWRKHGNSVGNIFGKGVSFTPISCYASHYSDKRITQRMMFVSKVLIAEETIGNKNMELPPIFDETECLRYDTATKENRQVIVKFADSEFYPSYVVYYTGQYAKKEQQPMRF